MDAAVIVNPMQYQRRHDERNDPPAPLRMLHFGPHHEGLVTFLVCPPDDLVLVVKIQWTVSKPAVLSRLVAWIDTGSPFDAAVGCAHQPRRAIKSRRPS
jgi:hypothetical protein